MELKKTTKSYFCNYEKQLIIHCILFVSTVKKVLANYAAFFIVEQASPLPDVGQTQMDEVWTNQLLPHPRHVPPLPGQHHHLRGHQSKPNPNATVLQLHILLPSKQHPQQPVGH